MSSQRRIDASRANGSLSKGPITPEGEARCCQNARTHGLTANSVVVAAEDKAQFQALLDSYISHYAPENPVERDLVEEMAVCKWRQRRVWTIEAAAIDVQTDRQQPTVDAEFTQIDDAARLSIAMTSLCADTPLLPTLSRYEWRNRRAYQRNMTHLDKIRRNRPSPTIGQLAA